VRGPGGYDGGVAAGAPDSIPDEPAEDTACEGTSRGTTLCTTLDPGETALSLSGRVSAPEETDGVPAARGQDGVKVGGDTRAAGWPAAGGRAGELVAGAE
jgi:hypothetical protein